MQSQRYRHRIQFQQQTESRDPVTGVITRGWEVVELNSNVTLTAVPAEVLTGPGREYNASNAKQAETSARINCHYFGAVDPAWRVVWQGLNYDILGVEYDATGRRETRLMLKQGAGDGS